MIQQVNLHCQEGGSDKIYNVFLEEQGGGYVVNFEYGRRGSSLKPGTKTNTPVELDKAKKIFDSLVRDKMVNGKYKALEDGNSTSGVHTVDKTDTGLRAQLLNQVDENEALRLLEDDNYILQEKKDGERRMLQKTGSELVAANRKGYAIGYSKSLDSLLGINEDFTVDGESMSGDVVFLFDMLSDRGASISALPFLQRFEALQRFVSRNTIENLKIVRTAIGTEEKKALYAQLLEEKAEGVVFKLSHAPYTEGKPNSGGTQLKYKFVETASFIVEAVNLQRSVKLSLLDENKNKVEAGNVTIPGKQEIPNVGDVIEVKYLYAFKESGSIFQPVFLGKRTDIDQAECVTTQLKYKSAA